MTLLERIAYKNLGQKALFASVMLLSFVTNYILIPALLVELGHLLCTEMSTDSISQMRSPHVLPCQVLEDLKVAICEPGQPELWPDFLGTADLFTVDSAWSMSIWSVYTLWRILRWMWCRVSFFIFVSF
jgi:hypothetical protein